MVTAAGWNIADPTVALVVLGVRLVAARPVSEPDVTDGQEEAAVIGADEVSVALKGAIGHTFTCSRALHETRPIRGLHANMSQASEEDFHQ